jgi:hypothetical protein
MTDAARIPTDRARPERVSAARRLAAGLAWIYAPALAHRRAWLVWNLIYFGLAILGGIYVAVDPGIQQTLLAAAGAGFSPTGPLGAVTEAYLSGQLLPAIAMTVVVNLVLGSFLEITLPSLVPMLGLLVGLFRAMVWGLLFSPVTGTYGLEMLPITLLLLLEGEGYVLAMLGVWTWWWPVLSRAGQRRRLWVEGVKSQARVYVAVAFTLLVAAVYEVALVMLVRA